MSEGEKQPDVTPQEVEQLFERLNEEAESAGYHLNPNREFTIGLIEGLLVNERRYGYWACPCRLASGVKKADLDIICPCDYRDDDIAEYGACFCALYVSQEIVDGKKKATRVPERRPPERGAEGGATGASGSAEAAGASGRTEPTGESGTPNPTGLSYPIWRCKVCGYLCARNGPPEVCPICRAKKERFERFL
jgi:ferredoxin-thioredoxin reductase catalytic chain